MRIEPLTMVVRAQISTYQLCLLGFSKAYLRVS